MKKAILEIEVPENCWGCPLSIMECDCEYQKFSCAVTGELLPQGGKLANTRDKNCPLKMEVENLKVVYCVMKNGKVFGIYATAEKAESIAEKMLERYGEQYHVETRAVL